MDATGFERTIGQTPADFARAGWDMGKILNAIWDHSGEDAVSMDLANEAAALLELEGLPMTPAGLLTPEAQIDNVLASLQDLVNGPTLPGRLDAIRSTVGQLVGLWQATRQARCNPCPLTLTCHFER